MQWSFGGTMKPFPSRRIAGQSLLLVLLLYGGHATAQDAHLKYKAFHEVLQPDVNVSGTVIVGLSADDLVDGDALEHIRIRPPSQWAGGEVCLSVVSRDGIYIARNTYVLPDPLGTNDIGLSYRQSRNLSLLKQYPARHLGILVQQGDCVAPGKLMLRPYARAHEAPWGSVSIMVNGLGATDVFYAVDESVTGRCEMLRDGRTTVFDFWCSIPEISDETGLADTVDIQIERERYGRELPAATITLSRDGR